MPKDYFMNYFPKIGKIVKPLKQPNTKSMKLGKGYDLFGDQSIIMFPLPGHAAGQHGALIQTEKGP